MNNEAKSYTVHIFDDQYTLVSDELQEHIDQSAAFVDSLMQDIAKKSGVKDVKKVAVLAALCTASTMLHLEKQVEHNKHKEDELVARIEQELVLT